MSRLIEKLKKQRQIDPQPMGFASLVKPAAGSLGQCDFMDFPWIVRVKTAPL